MVYNHSFADVPLRNLGASGVDGEVHRMRVLVVDDRLRAATVF